MPIIADPKTSIDMSAEILSNGLQEINLRIGAPQTLWNFLWKDIGLTYATERWYCDHSHFERIVLPHFERDSSKQTSQKQLRYWKPRGVLICRRPDHHVTGMILGDDFLADLTPELTGRPPGILSPPAYHWAIYPKKCEWTVLLSFLLINPYTTCVHKA